MKIGFLAMSGVRVQDAELMKLGLTLPGFVDCSQVIASRLREKGVVVAGRIVPSSIEVSI